MALTTRRTACAVAAAVMMITALAVSPAGAGERCDVVLHASVDGATISGQLKLSASPLPVGWSFTIVPPPRHSLEWLDGGYAVAEASSGVFIGGGVVSRSATIAGEFVRISACFVEDNRVAVATTRINPL